ncbi:MAG: aldehyde dehydrogenase family protein [Candidatus Eisenbacteria bacterium]|nr:aldehyde dehydrogenase family protein [Candidatus Eisenbacteria bacterium]
MTTPVFPNTNLLIAGERFPASNGAVHPTINPATAEKLIDVASATAEDARKAVDAAHNAFRHGPWPGLPATERGRILYKLADLLETHADEVATLESLDNGKPFFESRRIDVPLAVEALRYYAGWANKVHGEVLPVRGQFHTYTRHEPLGVVAAITPWNFPLLLSVYKVAAALTVGNTVVLKPAELTPLSCLRFGELGIEAGLPPGVLNILTGKGSVAGQALLEDPRVAKVAFTGSTPVGKSIMKSAADTLKRLSLELGGKSANIVFGDADLKAAVRGAINGIFYGKGEICTAGSRLLLHESIHDEFVEMLKTTAEGMKQGDPFDPKTRIGAQVSEAHMNSILAYIAQGCDQGARLVTGGERNVIGNGFFVKPTIFDNVTPGMTIAQEEIFGPVVAVMKFSSDDDAIALANDHMYGLAAGLWTNDLRRAHRLSARLEAGTVWVNTYNFYDPAAPFGGYKQSGFGRELGMHALSEYTQTKTVWIDLN